MQYIYIGSKRRPRALSLCVCPCVGWMDLVWEPAQCRVFCPLQTYASWSKCPVYAKTSFGSLSWKELLLLSDAQCLDTESINCRAPLLNAAGGGEWNRLSLDGVVAPSRVGLWGITFLPYFTASDLSPEVVEPCRWQFRWICSLLWCPRSSCEQLKTLQVPSREPALGKQGHGGGASFVANWLIGTDGSF